MPDWIPFAKGSQVPDYYGSALRKHNGTIELKDSYFRRMIEYDVLIPPGDSYDVQENDLDSLMIEWHRVSEPQIWYGRGFSDDEPIFVRIRPDIEEAVYVSCADYFTEICKNSENVHATDGRELVELIDRFVR